MQLPRTLLALAGISALAILVVSCREQNPPAPDREMQAFTWESKHQRAVALSAPTDWEWDVEYIESAKERDLDATGIQTVRPSEDGYADAKITLWEGPIDEWVETKSEVIREDKDEDLMAHETREGEVGGHPALFLQTDYEHSRDSDFTGTRVLEVYVMPDGNEWAWRVGCMAMLAHERRVADCEAIVNSVRPN